MLKQDQVQFKLKSGGTPFTGVEESPALASEVPGGQSRDSSSSSSSASTSGSSEEERSSLPTSDDSSSSISNSDAGSDEEVPTSNRAQPPGSEVTVDIHPPSRLEGYVLFGVQGSKRLQPAKTRLTQIDVGLCQDDDRFFDEMAVRYINLRGYLRWIFSIWAFRSCEFIRASSNGVID